MHHNLTASYLALQPSEKWVKGEWRHWQSRLKAPELLGRNIVKMLIVMLLLIVFLTMRRIRLLNVCLS